jgi:high-affinity nickel-transport protein
MQAEFTLGMAALGFSLGLRHGIDWDHIAAISDITSSTVQTAHATQLPAPDTEKPDAISAQIEVPQQPKKQDETRYTALEAFWLATFYALGHALMVGGLGLLAIWASEMVPQWFDPLMERIVGFTLLVLGFYVFYSLWRYGTSFRLRSRWMLVFALAGKAGRAFANKIQGRTAEIHDSASEYMKYGPMAAALIGILHGFGAETGSQALLLGTVAGATSRQTGSFLLLSFVIGLLVSNSLLAVFSVVTFISTQARQRIYTGMGILVAVFSLFVGAFFFTGHGDVLPALQPEIAQSASSSITSP